MSYITLANWCWLAYGWNPNRHAFDGNVVLPVAAVLVMTLFVSHDLTFEHKNNIPAGARRTLSLLFGCAAGVIWPIGVVGVLAMLAVPWLWETVRDTVSWLWEITDNSLLKLKSRRARLETEPVFPKAKVMKR